MASEASLTIAQVLPDAPFVELHTRIVDRPIEQVWPICLDVTVAEVRTIRPLMGLRGLPNLITHRGSPHSMDGDTPLLDTFASFGFSILRRDTAPNDGRASVLFGAAGKFWSVGGNAPVTFTDAAEFLDFDEPDFAKTVARLDAIDLGDGRTLIETETRVVGTDQASTKKFRPYWMLIRGPSGLIRRSWLAGIARRAQAT